MLDGRVPCDGMARRIGVWAAWSAAGLTAAFLATLIATPLMAPLPTEWRGAADYAAGFQPWTMLPIAASLLLVPPVLVLLAALHRLTQPELRALSVIGVVFGAVYGAIIAANDYLQLITVRGSLLAGRFEGLDPLVWTNPYSVFGSLEALGYLFGALAFAVLIPTFASGRHAAAIRWLLAVNLLLGIGTIVAQLAELYWLLFPGLVIWSLVFGPAMVLIALRLRSSHPASRSSA